MACLRCGDWPSPVPHALVLLPKERPVTARQICARVHACSGAAGPCARAAVVGLVLQHKQVRTCSGASLYHCKHPCHGNQSVFKAC